MNNFRFYFDCYNKARKKTTIVLWIIGIPLCILAGSPFLWYAMEYQAESIIWQIFVKIVLYTVKNSEKILPSKIKAKDSLGLGYENTVLKLCGIMKAPNSLTTFLSKMKEAVMTYTT